MPNAQLAGRNASALALPIVHDAINMVGQFSQFVGSAPGAHEVRIMALRRILDIAYADSNRYPGAYSGHECMLLGETRKLIKKCARTQSRSVAQKALVGFVSEPVSDDGAALRHHGLAEFARSLAGKKDGEAELPPFLCYPLKDSR